VPVSVDLAFFKGDFGIMRDFKALAAGLLALAELKLEFIAANSDGDLVSLKDL